MKISGPDMLSPDAKSIIKMVADEFLSRKKCKKVGYRSSEDIVGNVVFTGDDVDIEVSVGGDGGADEVVRERYKDKDRDEVKLKTKIEMKSMKTKIEMKSMKMKK